MARFKLRRDAGLRIVTQDGGGNRIACRTLDGQRLTNYFLHRFKGVRRPAASRHGAHFNQVSRQHGAGRNCNFRHHH